MERNLDRLLSPLGRSGKVRKSTGWHIIDGRTLIDRSDAILQDAEDLVRFVCEYLKYSPRDAWQMPVYEFYRDVGRAHNIYEAHKKEIERLKDKK